MIIFLFRLNHHHILYWLGLVLFQNTSPITYLILFLSCCALMNKWSLVLWDIQNNDWLAIHVFPESSHYTSVLKILNFLIHGYAVATRRKNRGKHTSSVFTGKGGRTEQEIIHFVSHQDCRCLREFIWSTK